MNRLTCIALVMTAFVAGLVIREGVSSQVAQLPDGGEYRGPLQDGQLQGEGEIRWRNGQFYQGGFERGLFQGRGEFRMADSSHYEGQFADGDFNGQGVLHYANGDVYFGQFKRGLLHGAGRYERNNQVYAGQFEKGEFTGQGTLTEGDELQYSGGFVNWQFDGEGQYFDMEGNSWKGTFVKGSLEGEGEYSGADGQRYRGQLKRWQYHGKGVFYGKDGMRYEGEFRYGYYHGKGTVFLAKPEHEVTQYDGTWRNGKLVSASVAAFIENSDDKVEQALYSENVRLQQQLAALTPETPGKTDLYFLGIAGDGTQRVFGREIDFVYDQLQQQYPLAGHSVMLINDRERMGAAVMATRISVEQAVQAIAAKMNPQEDVLLLYMTSHGSSDHDFVLRQAGLGLPDLPASVLADVLQKSGIQWQVIIVSACYSGGVIPLLEAPQRLVMTSAAADRTSFGCSDDAKLTYFGRALFSEAFPQGKDWVTTFNTAREWIEHKEEEEKITPSQPQIAVGNKIETKLAQLPRKKS